MGILFGAFIATLPWVAGALGGVLLARRMAGSFADLCWGAGAGGCFGYFLMAAALWVADQYARTALADSSVFTILILCSLMMIALVRRQACRDAHSIQSSHRRPENLIWKLAAVPVLAVVAIVAHSHIWLPTQGHDAFDYWNLTAFRFVKQSGDFWTGPFSPFGTPYRHPHTLPLISAWSAWTTHEFGTSVSGHWPWFWCWISIGLVTFGYSLKMTGSFLIATVLTYLALSFPLLENHAYIGSYSELWVTATILILVSALSGHSSSKKSGFVAMFSICFIVVATTATIFIRNTGVLYAAIPLIISLAMFLVSSRFSMFALGFSVTGIALVVAVIVLNGPIITIINNPLGFDKDTDALLIAGRSLYFRQTTFGELFDNQLYSWLLRGSFSVAIVSGFTLFFSCLFCWSPESSIFQRIPIYSVAVGLAVILASQFTTYGFQFSAPNTDTGGSRFTLPFLSVLILACANEIGRVTGYTSARGGGPEGKSDVR